MEISKATLILYPHHPQSEESSSDLAGFKPITSVPQSSLRTLLQRRFTNRTKIPIALTFQTPPQGDNESTHLRSPAQIITKHAPSVAKVLHVAPETMGNSVVCGIICPLYYVLEV